MSAFFVEYKTIDRILFGISELVRDSRTTEFYMDKELARFGIATTGEDWRKELGKDMLFLNARAMEVRYVDTRIEELLACAEKYRYSIEPVTVVQSIKSLQCWLYQCCEGNIPETEFYKFFSEYVMLVMLKQFVQNLPEYDRAEWR